MGGQVEMHEQMDKDEQRVVCFVCFAGKYVSITGSVEIPAIRLSERISVLFGIIAPAFEKISRLDITLGNNLLNILTVDGFAAWTKSM